MTMLVIAAVFLQAVLFKTMQLNARKLQELGVSSYGVMMLQRYAFFPALALLVITYRKEHFELLIQNPSLFLLLGSIAVLWIIGQYCTYLKNNAASSLSFIVAPDALLSLLLVTLFGVVINGDTPGLFAILAVGFLALALVVRPHQDKRNKRPLLRFSILTVVLIIVVSTTAHSLNAALHRDLLQQLMPALWFAVALYTVLATSTLHIAYLFKKPLPQDITIIKNNIWVAIAIPALWFIASLPEGFAKAQIPIYTFAALGSISFLMGLISDIRNKRISFDIQTVFYSSLVLISILFATLSVY